MVVLNVVLLSTVFVIKNFSEDKLPIHRLVSRSFWLSCNELVLRWNDFSWWCDSIVCESGGATLCSTDWASFVQLWFISHMVVCSNCLYPSSLRRPGHKPNSGIRLHKMRVTLLFSSWIFIWHIHYWLPAWNSKLWSIVYHSRLHFSLHLFHQLQFWCWLMGKKFSLL